MGKTTFVTWLNHEVASSSCALLKLYEEFDTLKYIEGPRLEKEYMDKIGTFEETVIKEEIECELLKKKQEMIQAAINRREPVDEAAIDEEISKLREEMIKEAGGDEPPKEFADLSEEQATELQEIYSEIVKNYHPETHPNLTDAHKELFKKAQEAYRRKDVSALKLIYDMLTSADGEGIDIELLMSMLNVSVSDEEDNSADERFTTDFTLVAELYNSFIPTSKEAAIQEEWLRYKQNIDKVMNEMTALKTQFPYTAAETLSNPDKLAEYKAGLEHRLFEATKERARLTSEIERMKEGVAQNG